MRYFSLLLTTLCVACLATWAAAQSSEGSRSEADTAAANMQLQFQVEELLKRCYLVGADRVGAGDVAGAKDILRTCFTGDMVWETVMPPAYAQLAFTTHNGADGFVDTANQVYRNAGFSRVHHLITNVVVNRVGSDTLRVTSSAHAIHVYADEHAFSAVVKFVDDFVKVDGVLMISHRVMTVIAANEVEAWTP